MTSIGDAAAHTCTGCGACKAICPADAISYEINRDGFFEAQVDSNKCVRCGKCTTVCLRFGVKEPAEKLLNAKMCAAQSTTASTVYECTSGGIAHEIAQWGIRQGFYVLGTVYNHATSRAEMRLVATMEEIEAFKGSKYIQSDAAGVPEKFVSMAKDDPKQGFVIFGTPCQIYGLRQLAVQAKLSNPIYYIDLFCHGVPSYLVWDAFRKEQGFAKTTQVEFRDHRAPWHFFHLKLANKEKYKVLDKEKATFYQLFFDNQSLNYSCSDCPVRKETSAADIRLGDFWGKRYAKRLDGVSLCAVMTENGSELMRQLQKENCLSVLQDVPAEEGLMAQSTHAYKTQQSAAFEQIQGGKTLEQIIRDYRKHAGAKSKLKWTAKSMIASLPMACQKLLRKIM